jgi:ribosomal protein S18 acetylase RimI-like enzyme
MSSITPALPYGDIKIINIVVAPNAQATGLEKLLVSALYKSIPIIKRMFIITRPTNYMGLDAYEQCGFVQDNNPIQDPNHAIAMEHFVVLEYKTEQSDIIQISANRLIE